MADYRELSQQYAQGAIKASAFINGGAAVSLLSQLKPLSELVPITALANALMIFVAGVALSALSWLFGFASTRHVDRYLEGANKDYGKANTWMTAGIVSFVLALTMFCLGSGQLAKSFYNQQASPPQTSSSAG